MRDDSDLPTISPRRQACHYGPAAGWRTRHNDPEQRDARAPTGFFAVDRRRWAAVCRLGIDEAVAYLVMARRAGPDNRATLARASIARYTGMSGREVERAILRLLEARVGIQRVCIREDLAYDLGAVRAPIWVPHALVTGAFGNEAAPVEQVRRTRDAMLLRLLVDCYDARNLEGDGLINRHYWAERNHRYRVGESGEYVVWGFDCPRGMVRVGWGPLTAPHRDRFIARVRTLMELELLKWRLRLCESDDPDATILQALGSGDPVEDRIANRGLIDSAALLTPQQSLWANEHALFWMPVPRNYPRAAVVGVLRLRYLPFSAGGCGAMAAEREQAASTVAAYRTVAIAVARGALVG